MFAHVGELWPRKPSVMAAIYRIARATAPEESRSTVRIPIGFTLRGRFRVDNCGCPPDEQAALIGAGSRGGFRVVSAVG